MLIPLRINFMSLSEFLIKHKFGAIFYLTLVPLHGNA
jgi:hypothetical protein